MPFERFLRIIRYYRSKREEKKLRVSRADLKKSEKIPKILASWTLATGLRIRAGGGMCYAERKPGACALIEAALILSRWYLRID